MWRTAKRLLAVNAVAGAACITSVGCSANGPVFRLVDGQVMEGRFIGEQAYASFLVGALAEESGDLRLALVAYERAARADPRSPEIWTRVGRTLCRVEPQGTRADAALEEALRRDPAYEPATLARKVCETFRREGAAGVDALLRIDALDPRGPAAYRLASALATIPATATDEERHALVALTLLHGDRVAAWDALATWGLAHGDVALAVRGMIGVARRVPDRRRLLGETAAALAAAGHPIEARELAAALLDADRDRSSAGEGRAVASMPVVARLAIDAALLAHDVEVVCVRTDQAHVGLAVAAGRAWAMGDLPLARSLIESTVKSDPSNLAAKLVYEGANGRGASWLLPGGDPTAPLPPEVALPLARLVLVSEGVAAARRVALFGGGTKLLDGDALMTPLAVDLTMAGVLPEDHLPEGARVALAARRKVSAAQ